VFENTVFPSARRPWSTGDLALLFTDGIYEVSGPGGDHFGLDRLLAAVQARATQPMPVLVAGLFTDVQQFAGSGEFSDDVCLVAVEAARLEHPAS
jgi:sigma-B regulation protein RsbU (phosphoserine phosphatase)